MLAARGNAFTTPEKVQALLLHKAAEMTVASGFEWFFFEGTQDVSQQGVFVSPAFGNAYASGNAAGWQGSASYQGGHCDPVQ
jgi:hypothetical protein